ncbi:MAG: GNAT family N-acetyltransferase [Gammaproteobacteria bacterium]|nr:GNAT family N-acetyltransferase [Gammaproteobacteria bacterium]
MADRIDPDINSLNIEPISKTHVRSQFSCGKPQLDLYLQQHARQNNKSNISKTFVAVDEENVVQAYYTLSAASIEFEELPNNIAKNLPKYPIPAARIGKFAVNKNASRQGLGEKLLIDALQRIVNSNNQIAVKVILVDALDDDAKCFWLKFGFIELPESDLKLFLSIETIQQLFNK